MAMFLRAPSRFETALHVTLYTLIHYEIYLRHWYAQ